MFVNRFRWDNHQSAPFFAFNIFSPQACMQKIKGGFRYKYIGGNLNIFYFFSIHSSSYTHRMTSCVCKTENSMFILFAGAYSGMLIVDHSTFRAFVGMAPCHPHSGSVYVVRHTLSSIVKSHSSTIRALQMRQMQLALETFPSVAYFTIKHCRAWDSNSPSSNV